MSRFRTIHDDQGWKPVAVFSVEDFQISGSYVLKPKRGVKDRTGTNAALTTNLKARTRRQALVLPISLINSFGGTKALVRLALRFAIKHRPSPRYLCDAPERSTFNESDRPAWAFGTDAATTPNSDGLAEIDDHGYPCQTELLKSSDKRLGKFHNLPKTGTPKFGTRNAKRLTRKSLFNKNKINPCILRTNP